MKLTDFFPQKDITWKPLTISKKAGKALMAPYITNRAIQQRLDDVYGIGNWYNEYKAGPDGGVICGITIYVPQTEWVAKEEGGFERKIVGSSWITKWDGAENTDVEPIKGGLSNSMKRAATQWGIGRYLYELPDFWIPLNDRGYPDKNSPKLKIPKQYLP